MTYRITFKFGRLDASTCPPAWITDVFPTFDGWPVTMSESECLVTAPDGVIPVPNPLLNIAPNV